MRADGKANVRTHQKKYRVVYVMHARVVGFVLTCEEVWVYIPEVQFIDCADNPLMYANREWAGMGQTLQDKLKSREERAQQGLKVSEA